MKIKTKVTSEQKEDIEAQLDRYENALKQAREEYDKKVGLLRKASKEYKDFWANNTKGVYDWRNSGRPSAPVNKLFETKLMWKDTNLINTTTLKTMEKWVCASCEKEAIIKYINAGNHRDYSYNVCNCEGARRNRKPYCELV